MTIFKFYTLDGEFVKETEMRYTKLHNFSGIKEYPSGTKEWFINGIRHRDDDNPAIVSIDGHKEWWINMKRHRIGGPAVIHSNGLKFWYINNIECSEEEHNLLFDMMKVKGLV